MIQLFLQKEKKIQCLIKLSIKPYINGWYPYQSCYEKRHFSVCGWVSFLARRFIRGNLTLFEILNRSFVLYTFISKKQHFLFCTFFSFCFAILQLWVCFQCSRLRIVRKCLHTMLSVAGKKQWYMHQRRAWIVRVNNYNFEILENVSSKNHYKSKGENIC